MLKPRTIDQFKVYCFLKEHFVLDHFCISPISRSTADAHEMRFYLLDDYYRCMNHIRE